MTTSTAAVDFVAPAFMWTPPRVGSYGDEAIDLARLYGREGDPEQQLAVDAMLSYGRGGKFVALEQAIIESRQNGKTTGVVLPVVIFDLWMLPADRIVWTAHLFKTTSDAFTDVVGCIERAPELSKRVKKITYGNGEESVELHSGALLQFLARSKGGGRGLGGKRVVMDEALYLPAQTMGALLPTLSARPDPQVMYASSAGVATSDHLRTIRDRGQRGGDPSLIYLEWCSQPGGCADGEDCDHFLEREGCALDDESKWLQANHALDRRITREYVRQERRAFARIPLEFARERLGWWSEPLAVSLLIFALDVWNGKAKADKPEGDAEGFAVDMTPERSWTSIGVLGDNVVDVVEHRPGTEWVIDACVKLHDRWRVPFAVDPKGPAGNLIEDLREAGVNVVEPKPEDVARACADFYDAIVEGQLQHTARAALDAAAEGAKKRNVGDGFAWDRKKGAVISPLYAVTLAMWAAAKGNDVQVFGAADLDMCDACGINPHEDPVGDHGYLCAQCRPEEE